MLGRIAADRGELDLEFLRALPPAEAHAYLLNLPGIGRKTVAVVLLFTFDMPFFPVDTHVLRVSKRLGLVPELIDADRAHDLYDAMLKPEQMLPLHLALIWHGRARLRGAAAALRLLRAARSLSTGGGGDMTPERAQELLEAARGRRVLLVGDLMLDEWVFGSVKRISPEAPIPVVRMPLTHEARADKPGGAGNVAAILLSLGAAVKVVGVIGDDALGERLEGRPGRAGRRT